MRRGEGGGETAGQVAAREEGAAQAPQLSRLLMSRLASQAPAPRIQPGAPSTQPGLLVRGVRGGAGRAVRCGAVRCGAGRAGR